MNNKQHVPDEELKLFVQGYIVCALWTTPKSYEDPNGFLDEEYTYDDIDLDTLHGKIIPECRDFMEEVYSILPTWGKSVDYHGHDFYLTRNAHGAGFWDRGYDKKVSDELCAVCKQFGSVEFWVENGKVFCD